MSFMFSECKNLKNLNISSFETNNVKDMKYMFNYCENIINLNLSKLELIK